MLDRIGIRPGWTCLDLGCGAMGILGPLSRRVGPAGRVIGIDTEAPMLASARTYVQEQGLTNVEVLERNASDSGLPRDSFDFVHERFVFPHVAAPEALLREMVALARPGGIVAVQEPDHSSWNFYPPSSKWPRLLQIIEAGFGLRSDINIGRRTYHMLRRAGLEDVTVRAGVLALQNSHPYMRMPIVGATAMRKTLIGAGLTTDAELDDLLADLEQRVSDPETFQITFTVTQVWGRKPRS
jgi:SAM-dependent methyltransferase